MSVFHCVHIKAFLRFSIILNTNSCTQIVIFNKLINKKVPRPRELSDLENSYGPRIKRPEYNEEATKDHKGFLNYIILKVVVSNLFRIYKLYTRVPFWQK